MDAANEGGLDPKDAPAPPTFAKKHTRTRVRLEPPKIQEEFQRLSAGTPCSNAERGSFVEQLSQPAFIGALAPHLDQTMQSNNQKPASVSESRLINLHGGLLDALSALSVSEAILESDKPELAPEYRRAAREIISFLVHDITVIRRERALLSLNLKPNEVMPSFRSAPLSQRAVRLPGSDSDTHLLFDNALLSQLTEKGDSDVKKAISRLSSKRKDDKQPSTSSAYHRPAERKDFRCDFVPNPAPGFLKLDSDKIAGRLADFAFNWRLLSQSKFVLDAVLGYKIPFICLPKQKFRRPPKNMNASEQCATKQEVEKLIKKGAIRKMNQDEITLGWISSIFIIPKKDGSWRPIINLRGLNSFVDNQHFKMENLVGVKDSLLTGDFMAKIDMQDAYFGIPIHPEHQKFLGFEAAGKHFCFTALPFGLCTAPRVYTKVMRPVAALLRSFGIRIIVYLDDWLFMNQSAEGLKRDLKFAQFVFDRLGMLINEEKSILIP